MVFGKQSSNEDESQFLDENGAVNDMDGYLNYHSFEYDSVWDTKPSWLAILSCFFIVDFEQLSKIYCDLCFFELLGYLELGFQRNPILGFLN